MFIYSNILPVAFNLSIFLFIYLSIYFWWMTFHLCLKKQVMVGRCILVWKDDHWPIYLNIRLDWYVLPFIYIYIYPSFYLSNYQSINISIFPSINLSIFQSFHLSIPPSLLLEPFKSSTIILFPSLRTFLANFFIL